MSNNNPKKTAPTIESACVIVKGTVIEGEFKSKSDTRMDGTIIGNVTCDARMIIGPSARIEGNITSQQANISGTFTGDIQVKELLTLTSTAKVEGTVVAKDLCVEEGAMLNGDVQVGKSDGLARKVDQALKEA